MMQQSFSKKIHGYLKRRSGLAWLFATMLALMASRALYLSFDPALKNFNGRIVGMTVLEGIDAPARILQFYTIVGVFVVVLFASFLVVSFVLNKISKPSWSVYTAIEKEALHILLVFACVIILLNALNNFHAYNEELSILLSLILATSLLIVIKPIILWKNAFLRRVLTNYPLLILSLLFPLVIFFLGWFFLQSEPIFKPLDIFWYLVLLAVFYLSYFLLYQLTIYTRVTLAKVNRALLLAAIPFLCIPASFSFVNELLYFLFIKGLHFAPKTVVAAVIMFLLLLCLIIFFVVLVFGNKKYRASTILNNVYFPILILTCALLTWYTPTLSYSTIDTFHFGENLIVTQQLFQFHRIPYLDILPTHGFAETIYHILYSLVFGYRTVEPGLWSWIDLVLFSLLIYFFIKKYFSPLAALLFTLLLPFGILYPSFYSFMMVPAFALLALYQKPTFRPHLLLWLVSLFMAAWRIDFGMTTIMTFGVVIGVDLFILLLQGNKKEAFQKAKMAVFSFVAIFLSVGLLVLIITTIRGQSFFNLLKQLMLFIQIQTQSMSVSPLGNFSNLAVLEYLLLPLVSVFMIVMYLLKRFSAIQVHPRLAVLFFLAVASLFLMTRSLQRHGVGGRYNPILFVFLIVLIPQTVDRISKRSALVMSLAIATMYLFVFPMNSQDNLVKTEGPFIHVENFTSQGQRVKYQLDEGNVLLAQFFKSNLQASQTYFDMSNDLFLYVETGKEHIPFIIPNILLTGDEVQRMVIEKLEKYRVDGKVPFVVFKQGNGWDALDDVPNEVRSSLITEYVYQHYHPFAKLDRFEVWIENGLNTDPFQRLAQYHYSPLEGTNQTFDLKLLPYIWGTYDQKQPAQTAKELEVILDRPTLFKVGRTVLPISLPVNRQTGNYLMFRIQTAQPEDVTIHYGRTDGSWIKFRTAASKDYQTYLIRVSTQWQWMSENADHLFVDVPEEVLIEKISILQGD